MICPLRVDTVEKVVSHPLKRNNRIRTASYLNRNCVRGRDFESMLRIWGRKIVFQQHRSKADMWAAIGHVRFTPNSDCKSGLPRKVMSALAPKADMCGATAHVCYGP
jgi:hypothetical protein